MIKKKISMFLATLMVATTLTGINMQYTFASTTGTAVSSIGFNDGLYTFKNTTEYTDPSNSTGSSMARSVISEETSVKIKDGKVKMTFAFSSNMYGFLKDIKASLNGTELVSEIDNTAKTLTVEVPSVDSKVLLEMTVTIMGKAVAFYVENDLNQVTLVNEAPILTGTDVALEVGDSIDLSTLVSATDKEDGNIALEISGDTSFVSNGKVVKSGTFALTYTATDSQGLESTKTIKVVVNESTQGILEDGEYTLTNDVEYYKAGATVEEIQHGYSSARGVLTDTTKVTVKDGKITMTLTFADKMYSFLDNIRVSLDGADLNGVNDTTAKTLTFEVPSIDSKILLSMGITVMKNDVEFYVLNDVSTLVKVEDSNSSTGSGDSNSGSSDSSTDNNESNNNGSNSGNTGSDNSGSSNSGSSNGSTSGGNTSGSTSGSTSNATKVYSIENEVSHESETGVTMARKYLNSLSKVEEIDGKLYVTFTFTGVEFMNSHEIYVAGKKVNHTVVSSTDSELQLRFKVSDLSQDIKVKTYVIPMGRSIEFGVGLLEDTLTLLSSNEEFASSNGSSSNSGTSSNSGSTSNDSISGNASNSTTESSEASAVEEEKNVTEKVTVREYKVQNNVIHESETGVAMARKYLSSTSYVKEINGKYYVTLTFTGINFMENHQIYVNGSLVNHTVVSSSSDSISIRFEVGSLEDSITVNTYVTPMSRNVEFGVELLLDTLTLVNEYTIEPDQVENEVSLPNTGSRTSSAAVALLGLLTAGAGAVLTKKRK